MWLLFALLTFVLWGTADLFYKKSNSVTEKYTHLKTAIFVGLVMGIHAIATLCATQTAFNFRNILIYLPVSLMYILSMIIGYFGLRYLELSISSPIQNASGAVTCLLLIIALKELPDAWSLAAVALITAGVIWLGVIEHKQCLSEAEAAEKKHRYGFVAVLIPVLYCIIDSLGTFFDGLYIDDFATSPLLGVTEENLETIANCSYELTFLLVAVVLAIYVFGIRKEPLQIKGQSNRLAAAVFETAGQFTYVYALSGNAVVAAPVIASYCVCSVLLARLFLKEKLNKKQWLAVTLVIAGIVILGILEGLAE